MTPQHTIPTPSPQDIFARKITARLSDGANALPHDISERLRVARMQALSRRKVAIAHSITIVASQSGGTAGLALGGNDAPSWWARFASALPLVALVAGLLAIYVVEDDNRTNELVEVDTALLTDDLPTAAYTDPGFAAFLKADLDVAP